MKYKRMVMEMDNNNVVVVEQQWFRKLLSSSSSSGVAYEPMFHGQSGLDLEYSNNNNNNTKQ